MKLAKQLERKHKKLNKFNHSIWQERARSQKENNTTAFLHGISSHELSGLIKRG